jgi:hypothetical protein
MDRLAHLKRELERRFPTVEDVRAQAPNPNEFAGDVKDHKIYEFFNPMVVRLRHATRRAARSRRSMPRPTHAVRAQVLILAVVFAYGDHTCWDSLVSNSCFVRPV